MHRFSLHTLGTVSLRGSAPVGEIALDEPRLIALVVLLAVAGDDGESDDELLLRLTPADTAERGRAELARLIALLRVRLGGDASLVRTANRWAIAPGLVTMDVRLRGDDAMVECVAFLQGFKLPGSPEFREWLTATRRRVEPRVGRELSDLLVRTMEINTSSRMQTARELRHGLETWLENRRSQNP